MTKFTELDKLAHEGYLRRVISPCEKLILYNYTDKCTYEGKWDKNTLKSRGTVYNRYTGEVVAQAFPKFFNFGEHPEEKQTEILNETNFKVYDKLDGSLGIIYFFEGSWRVNTRGSFTSDQAIKATSMLSKYQLDNMSKDMTFLVEIIYPENRIILDYGDQEKLVLLGCYQDGIDLDAELSDIAYHLDMEVAQAFEYSTIVELVELRKILPSDTEGFVVRLSNGERVKFKGEDYLKIARILSGCSPLTFWESMKNGIVNADLLMSIPEEFRPEFEPIAHKLQGDYEDVYTMVTADALKVVDDLGFFRAETEDQKRTLGIYLKDSELTHRSALFSVFLTKHEAVDRYVMKLIKPKGNVLK